MTKYVGLVGYGSQVETAPGVWVLEETTKKMRGDLIRQNANISDSGKVNDTISLNHRLSLMGDRDALSNYHNMKWVEVDGRKWTIESVEIHRPRLILTLGGYWNG